MQALVISSYRTLLKLAVRVDSDPAARALLATCPIRGYCSDAEQWVNIDPGDLPADEWPRARGVLESEIRRLNGGSMWWRPILRGVNQSDEEAAAAVLKIKDDSSLTLAVKKTFRKSPYTSLNIAAAFAAIRITSNISSMMTNLMTMASQMAVEDASAGADPLPPTNYGFLSSETPKSGSADEVALLAAHPLLGSFFSHSILLIDHSGSDSSEPDCSIALTINAPFYNKSSDDKKDVIPVWSAVGCTSHNLFSRHLANNPVMFGGPINGPTDRKQAVFIIHRVAGISGCKSVAPGIFMSGDMEELCAALDSGKTSAAEVLVVIGYARWGVNQLEGEIQQGSWFSLWNDRRGLEASEAADKGRCPKTNIEKFVEKYVADADGKNKEEVSDSPSTSRSGVSSGEGEVGLLDNCSTEFVDGESLASGKAPEKKGRREVKTSEKTSKGSKKKGSKASTLDTLHHIYGKITGCCDDTTMVAPVATTQQTEKSGEIIARTSDQDPTSATRSAEEVMSNLVFQHNVLMQPPTPTGETAEASKDLCEPAAVNPRTHKINKIKRESWTAFVAGLGPDHARVMAWGNVCRTSENNKEDGE